MDIDYFGQIEVLEEFEKEFYSSIENKPFGEMTSEELMIYKKEYEAIKELLDELLKQLENNKEELKEEDYNLAMESAKELDLKLTTMIDSLDDQIKLANGLTDIDEESKELIDRIEEEKKEEIKEKEKEVEKKIQEEIKYFINKDIMDLLLNNPAISVKDKYSIKEYEGKELSNEEYEKFLDVVSDSLLKYRFNATGELTNGIVNENVLFNFEKHEKVDRLKQMMRTYNGRSLTKSEIKAIRDYIVKDFVGKEKVQKVVATPEIVDLDKFVENKDKIVNSSEVITVARPTPKPIINGIPRKDFKEEVKKDAEMKAKEYEERAKELASHEAEIPKMVPQSLRYYIVQRKLPNNIVEEKLVEICKDLGINVDNFDSVITSEDLERLTNDKVIKIAKNNQIVTERHNAKIDDYNKLISKYNYLLECTKSARFSDKYIAKLQESIKVLQEKASEYQAKVDNIRFDSVDEVFEVEDNLGVSKKFAQGYDSRGTRFNERLREEYENFDKLSEDRKETLSKRQQKRIDRRIEKSKSRIERLRSKESRMSEKQIRVVNKNTEKYIERETKLADKYYRREAKAVEYTESIIDKEIKINEMKAEQSRIRSDLSRITGNTRSDRRDRRQLEADMRKLESKIGRLRMKQGFVDLEYQVSRSITRSR